MVAFSRQRAVEIIKESSDSMSEGKPVEQLSAKKIKAFKKTVNLNVLKIKKLLDIEIKPEEAVKIFNKMGINSVVLEDKNIIKTEIPSFREDLARDVDLIEELARIKGYDKIPAIIPLPSKNEFLEKKTISLYQKEKWARDAMICLGMNEIITYSLLSREDVEKFGYKGKDLIKIANPLSCEQEILRPVMIPSFLKVAAWNINRSNNNLRFFETGKTYHFTGEDNIEIRKIAVGIFRPAEYDIKNNIDKGKLFLELKGILEAFFCKLMITNFIFSPGTS
jgi:phenylalanyl-tRNA synthetase beta chain